MTGVIQHRLPHVQSFYSALARVDLGADAANLYWRPGLFARLFPPRWVGPLRKAYRAAPGRLVAHAVPLLVDDFPGLRDWLSSPRGALADITGQELCRWLLTACEAEAVTVSSTAQLEAGSLQTLEVLHHKLWEERERPVLEIRLCDALRDGQFTHGRAVTLPGKQVVAVAVTPEPVFAAIQVFHEATHAVSDPAVGGVAQRDTAAGSAGFEQHMRIERAAVEFGQRLIEDHAPSWLGPYDQWRTRHGMAR